MVKPRCSLGTGKESSGLPCLANHPNWPAAAQLTPSPVKRISCKFQVFSCISTRLSSVDHEIWFLSPYSPNFKISILSSTVPKRWSFPAPSHECMVHVYCNDRSQPTMLEAEKYTRTAACRQGKQHASTHCETGDTKVEGSSPNPQNVFRGFYRVVTINGCQHGTQIIVNDWCATFWQTDIQWIVSWQWVPFWRNVDVTSPTSCWAISRIITCIGIVWNTT